MVENVDDDAFKQWFFTFLSSTKIQTVEYNCYNTRSFIIAKSIPNTEKYVVVVSFFQFQF